MLKAQLWTAARYLGKIFLAGLCEQHKQYPRVYIWYDHIGQTTTTCCKMENNIETNCMYYVQSVLLVVHRFCIFWCIHQMYSATFAQSSSKYCRPYYLFRSLFPISCFLVLCPCLCTDYAIVQFSHHVFLSCNWPRYRALKPNAV